MSGVATRPQPVPRLTHQGLIYGSDEEFLAATVPFCRDGLERGEAVLAVTTRANIDLLRDGLGPDARQVEFVDAESWYRAPGRTLGAYYRYVDDHAVRGARPLVRVIGEPVWHGRDDAEIAEWTRYESVINLAFADCPAWIVCPYDTRALPDTVVADARRTHPELRTGRSAHRSHRYADPGAGWDQPLVAPPTTEPEMVLRFGADLAPLRAFVTRTATALGLPADITERLVFAVNEVATNAVRHGGGHGELTVRRNGARVVCDITNPRGNGTAPAWYLGYLPPDPDQPSGHGLWTVRQLCDLVEIHAGEETTTVRVQVSRR